MLTSLATYAGPRTVWIIFVVVLKFVNFRGSLDGIQAELIVVPLMPTMLPK